MRLFVDGLFIKVSGVTSEEDALMAIGLGANAVSFDFLPSERRVEPAFAHDIIRRLPPEAWSVGRFRQELPTRVVEVANTLGLRAVELEGPLPAGDVAYIAERVPTVIRVVDDPVGESADGVDYLQSPRDPSRLDEVLGELPRVPRPLIVAGELTVDEVSQVVQHYAVWGVDVGRSVESAAGVKDPALLGDFIANARWAETNAYVERPVE